LDFLSLSFGGLSLATVLLFHAARDVRWRQAVVGLASALYLASFVSAPEQLAALGAFLALGFGLVQLARRKPGSLVFGAGVVLLLACFAWLKRYSALEALPQPPPAWVTVGLSYILFRVLQLAIDELQNDGRAPVGPLGFLLFTCSFLTLVSGPIQRYDDHRAQLAKLGDFSLDAAGAYAGLSRMANGLLKVALVSTALLKLHGWVLAASAPAWATFGAAALIYLFFLYANFSGSIDIVLGLGALLGFALPENFLQPFRAGNLLEFWNHWHVTLSQWFKFYVFNPLLKLMGQWFKTPAAMVWAGVLGYVVTFFLMGLWHGTTFAFVLFGALLGVGAGATKLYESVMIKRLGKKGLAALRARHLYAAAANGFTLAYVAGALSLWWAVRAGSLSRAPAGVLVAGILMTLVRLPLTPNERSESKGLPITLKHHLWLGARAWLIAAIAFDSSFHVPELLYRGF
jgi:alginate O-acetyltransferase complex protein AlgI